MSSWCNCAGIYAQKHVKRALEVAAVGGHNVVLNCGSGLNRSSADVRPTRLRQGAAGALPPLDTFGLPRVTPTETLDVTRIYSVAGTAQRARATSR
jgi:magnesium chelatase family protein